MRAFKPMSIAMAIVVMFVSSVRAQPLAELVPDDALIYVGWRGASDLGPGYAGSRLKGVLDASNVPALIEEFLPRLAAKMGEEGAGELGTVAPVLAAMWKYPTAFYYGGFEFPEDGGPIPKVALMCKAGADAAKLMQQVQDLLDETGAPAMVNAKGGVVTVTLGKVPPAGKGIAGNAKFAAAMKNAGKDAVFVAFADVEAVLANIDKGMAMHGSPREQKQYDDVVKNLGLRGFKRAVVTFGFEGKDWATRAYIEAPAPRAGLLALLDGKPVSDAALKLVPKSAAWMTAMRFDLARMVTEIRAVVAKFDPATAEDMDAGMAELNKQLGFDLEKDLLGALGDEWVIYTDANVGGTGMLGVTVVNRPRDAKKLAGSLLKLQDMAGQMLREAVSGEWGEVMDDEQRASLQLRELSLAAITYSDDYRGNLPKSMADLKPYLGGQVIDKDPWGQPYQYFGNGANINKIDSADTVPLAATSHAIDGRRIAVYVNGHVELVEEATFKKQMEKAKLAYKEPVKVEVKAASVVEVKADKGKTGVSRKHVIDGITVNYLSVPAVAPAWAIEGDAIFIAMYPQVVASAASHVKSGGATILDNAAYLDLRKRLGGPAGANAVSFYDLQQTAGEGYQIMLLISQLAMGAADMYGLDAPAMVIPPLHKLRAHLTPAGGVSWSDATGWYAASLTPFPGAEVIGTQQTMFVATQSMAVGILLPALGSARRTARQMQSVTQTRGLNSGCILYAQGARDNYPPDFATILKGNYVSPEYFLSPNDSKKLPPDFHTWQPAKQGEWINANTSYCYIPGMKADNDSTKVAIFERLHTPGMAGISVCFNDNHAVWMRVDEASELIKKQTGKTLEEWSKLKTPGAGK